VLHGAIKSGQSGFQSKWDKGLKWAEIFETQSARSMDENEFGRMCLQARMFGYQVFAVVFKQPAQIV
jgi:hypothetical protein